MGLTRPRFSQFDTTISSISDPVTVLNKSATLANVDVGFIINRDGGALANTAIFWNESANTFALTFTTNTGELPNANIAISEYANLRINTLTADTATFSSTGAIKIPTGNTAQRTAGTTGQIRFNTSTSQFEGYQGASWSSLGGVRSVDNNTYIIAESSAGAGDNILQFFAGGNRQANLSSAGLTVTANVSAGYFTGNGSQLTGINAFSNVFISGQSPVQADSISDTLTLVGGTGISITANASLDTITIATVSAGGPFSEAGDFGAVNDPVTVSEDEGSVADGATITYDLGSIISATGLMYPDQLVLPSYSVSTLPSATVAAQLVYNTTANGLAFSDGINWSNITASYSNVQVTTYLPTHTGNVNAAYYFGNGSQLTGIVVGSSYSNVQVASYLTVNPPAGTYSNVQVASYLPSYNGNIYTRSIGVGTNSFGNVGEIRATNYITSFYSDRRLKTDIVPITNALNKVTQLSGVIYTQNKLAETFGYTDYSQQVGVLAQEVQLVQPEAVKPAPFDIASDGSSISGEHYLTVQYEKLIPLLIEAIKELQSEVDGLKQQIGNANGSNTNRH